MGSGFGGLFLGLECIGASGLGCSAMRSDVSLSLGLVGPGDTEGSKACGVYLVLNRGYHAIILLLFLYLYLLPLLLLLLLL